MTLLNFRFVQFLKLMSYCADKQSLRRMRYRAWTCFILSLLNALSLALMPLCVGKLINALYFASTFFNFDNSFYRLLGAFVLLIIINVLSKISLEKVSYRLLIDDISSLRAHIFKLFNYNVFARNDAVQAGGLANLLLNDTDNLAKGLDLYLKQLSFALCSLIFTLLIMLSLNVPLALLIAVLSPLALIITNFLSHNTYRYFKLSQNLQAEQNALITDRLNCHLRIASQGNKAYEYRKFRSANVELKEAWHQALFFVSLSNPVNRAINNFIYIVICALALLLLQSGHIDLAALTAFLAYTNQFSKPFSDLSTVLTELQSAYSAVERLELYMKNAVSEFALPNSESSEAIDKQHDTTRQQDDKGTFFSPAATDCILAADNLCFSYHNGQEILHDIALRLNKGETIALIGPSGSGKSTLINLIMRFYQPDKGNLNLYQQSYHDVALATWRKEFSMVLQESWIFEGTIRENLLLAAPEADEKALLTACQAAGLGTFIATLPAGLDTLIADGALTLSHGQKQLLALARLFLLDSNIILLDEAGSAIDCYNEVKIQKSLQALRRNKAAVIVAHRLATVYRADLILVMQDGKIKEAGKHTDLLRQNGLYKRLWQAQFPAQILNRTKM